MLPDHVLFSLAALALLAAAPLAHAAPSDTVGTNTDASIRKALLAQRDAITNWEAFAAANNMEGWKETTPDVCSWTGVNCTANGTLYRLDFSCDYCLHCPLIGEWDFNLCAKPRAQGGLVPELASIGTLRQLYIKGQELSGPLPDAWADEGAFASLTDLALENNSIAGTLPASWGRPGAFPNVWRIWLNDNNLTGTLPPSWGAPGALKNLTWLKLHNNELEGSIPCEWGQLDAFARMRGNNATLCPTGLIGQFQKCEITLANNTELSGWVPPSLAPVLCAQDARGAQRLTCVAMGTNFTVILSDDPLPTSWEPPCPGVAPPPTTAGLGGDSLLDILQASTLIGCDDPQFAALAEAAWSSERQNVGAPAAAACPERAANWTALCTCMENEYIPLGRCPACASKIFKEQLPDACRCALASSTAKSSNQGITHGAIWDSVLSNCNATGSSC